MLLLANPANFNTPGARDAVAIAAHARGLGFEVALATRVDEIEKSIAEFASLPSGGLLVAPDGFFANERQAIAALAFASRLPAVYPNLQFTEAGGLVSYGANRAEMFKGAASYVDRLLRGARVVDLPVQMPSAFETVVNLKTARAMGLTISQQLLLHVDEVIE